MAALRDLRAKHVYFHHCAGRVLGLAQAGRKAEAIGMLEEGEYARASDDITAALVGLFLPVLALFLLVLPWFERLGRKRVQAGDPSVADRRPGD